MTVTEYHPSAYPVKTVKNYKKPFYKVEIIKIDHSQIYHQQLSNWNRSQTCEVRPWKYLTVVGLPASSGASSVDLTQTINIEEDGEYWINIIGSRGPLHTTGLITVKIDGTVIDEPQKTFSQWDHVKWFDFGFHKLTAGNKAFTITVNKTSWVTDIVIYKVERYTGKRDGVKHSNTRLDVKNVEFTTNTIGELNSCTIEVANKPHYLEPDQGWSGYKFNDWDVVNVWVNEDTKNTKPDFGGYILDSYVNEDGETIIIECVDRLRDLMRQIAFINFLIGVNARSDETSEYPHIQFANALEGLRYLAETQEKGLNTEKIFYPMGLNIDFAIKDNYDKVTTSGFTKKYETKEGSPGPCLQIGLDKLNVNDCGITDQAIEIVLFDDPSNPKKAHEDNFFSLKYMAPSSSCSDETRLQFNIGITMYKAGQNPSQAVEYNIGFTGKAGVSNLIDSIIPILNNTWQTPKLNLKAAFDKYAYSTEYYITKIRLWDNANSSQVTNREKMVLYIQRVDTFDEDINAKIHSDQATDKPYNLIKVIADAINYVVYVEYDKERRNDALVVTPYNSKPASIFAEEGVNILSITENASNPMDYVANKVKKTFHYTRDDIEHTESVEFINWDAYIHQRGSIEHYEDLSDVENRADAEQNAKKHIDNNSYPKRSFTIELEGVMKLTPEMYLPITYLNRSISGDYPLKTIKYTLNVEKDEYKISVDFGEASDIFYDEISKLYTKMRENINKNNRSMYTQSSLSKRGISGLGGFIKST